MKVVSEPITLWVDRKSCELSILTGGLRLVLNGGEACAFWGNLAAALEEMYAECPSQCPPAIIERLLGRALIPAAEDGAEACAAVAGPSANLAAAE